MAMLEASRVAALAADPTPVRALVDCLRASGYETQRFLGTLDAESVTEFLGRTAFYALLFGDDFATSDDRLERLFAWLTLGAALTPRDYETMLPSPVRFALEQSGLVSHAADGSVRATITLVEQDGLFICADRLFELIDGELQLETAPMAMPPHLSTMRLLTALSRLAPARSLLDVGTGAGSVALLAGSRYEITTGFDLQPRAAAMAQLNARLNGRRNCRFTVDDCLTFDDGRHYDHIVFNSPGASFDLVDAFAARVPGLLAQNGVCVILAWMHLPHGLAPDAFLAGHAARWRGMRLSASLFARSPFSAAPAEIASGRPRVGSYLTPELLVQLRDEGVCQRIEVTLRLEPLTLTRESPSAAGSDRFAIVEEESCAYTA